MASSKSSFSVSTDPRSIRLKLVWYGDVSAFVDLTVKRQSVIGRLLSKAFSPTPSAEFSSETFERRAQDSPSPPPPT